MPISPIVLQRRHAELGRIRLGAKRNGNGAPMKLSAFRFTSPSEGYIRDLATLYGGQARKWDNNGKPEWEVYTDATSIPVIAVKGGLSQWLEAWSGGGLVHRCTGEVGADGEPCNPDDPNHQAAKPTTRLSVMLPELEAVGVFRMESHGWNAAAEIPAVAELALYVGDLVPANLHLVERRTIKDGQTSRFVVPVLDLQIGVARLREIVAEKSGQTTAVEAKPETKAIASGPTSNGAGGPRLPTVEDIANATSRDSVANIWRFLKSHDALTPELEEACTARVADLANASTLTPSGSDGDAERSEDDIWQDILARAGELGMTETQLNEDFARCNGGIVASAASAGELQAYLTALQERAA